MNSLDLDARDDPTGAELRVHPRSKTKRRFWGKLALVLAACGLSLLAFELVCRLIGPARKAGDRRYHPILGWTQPPNLDFQHRRDGVPVRVRCNALGFRDHEHAVAKPVGTRRIVVVGDSFCESLEV